MGCMVVGFVGAMASLYMEYALGFQGCFMCQGYRWIYSVIFMGSLLKATRLMIFSVATHILWSLWDILQRLGYLASKCTGKADAIRGEILFQSCQNSSLSDLMYSPTGWNAAMTTGLIIYMLKSPKPKLLLFLLGTLLNTSVGSAEPPKECRAGKCSKFFVPPEDSYQAYTFMSFSVPENIWLEINEDLQKVRGAFILNGLPGNSMREFSTRVAHLRKIGITVPILIDPKKFKALGVKSVPATAIKEGKDFRLFSGAVRPSQFGTMPKPAVEIRELAQ